MKEYTNRKTATKLLLVQWSRFQNECIRLSGSTLLTGVNGTGKSTILDAVTYLLTGNTQFNKAAKDRDRTVLSYVRGDTRSNGTQRYLRFGEVISYIAMEFWSPVENAYLVVAVCIESTNETATRSGWFVCRDTRMDQINFTVTEGRQIHFTPKNELVANGRKLKSADFLGRDRGVEQVLRALGLRCDVAKYRSRLVKMMAFNPENNIDKFIQECVLDPGKVDSLKELREQKNQFEQIREMYENLRDSKTQLEKVEERTVEYERKKRALLIRELMLDYQEVREKEETESRLNAEAEELLANQGRLEVRKKELDVRFQKAGDRLRIAESNNIYQGMQESIRYLRDREKELDAEITQHQSETAKLKKLSLQMTDLLKWSGDYFDVSGEERQWLANLAEKNFDDGKRSRIFREFGKKNAAQKEIFQENEVNARNRCRELDGELSELERTIKSLESNRMVFPREVEEAKRVLAEEFSRRGIYTDVRVFAELVQEVRDPEWRAAIETFLGRKRFHIIVDGDHCHEALEIMQEKHIHGANVVVTDKLPETDITPDSAAGLLVIPNIYARRYANYLLNGIHLCADLRELHEHPKGGLMKDGMLAKSYAVACMEIRKTMFCLGADAVKIRLEKARAERDEKTAERAKRAAEERQCKQRRGEIEAVDWNPEHYDFAAPLLLAEKKEEITGIRKDIQNMQDNPDFMAVLQEQQDAKREYDNLNAARDVIVGDISACKTSLAAREEQLRALQTEIYLAKQRYEEKRLGSLELEQPMREEYERLLRGKEGTFRAITEKTVRNLRGEVDEAIRQLESAQLEYCKIAGTDINLRGVGYIPYYREQYRNVANVRIEEAHNRLREQEAKLESAFMNDFVAELNETIREAKAEIASINQELKQMPFGQDTYRFVMEEKADRNVFFRICRRLEQYMNSPELYMNTGRDDEEMEHDIREFMNIILEEENEEEYTDYRKYFIYDMKIVSRQGEQEITADLSKKQGIASGGEKQTPYFIILAASLLQFYPPQTCCARLAFIDEAFSALSRERIEQMVKYLEDNHFQVFYAAPPEKISSIGSFIESTVSLVMSGRYTYAVEGLVEKENP